jgi:phosphoglycerate kinase
LSELLGKPVTFVDDCIGEKVEKAVSAMKNGDVLLLENVRYYKEEEANDPAFAEKLAKVADVYVNDAFGAAHRAHASTEGVARVVAKRGGKCAAGLLMERELKFLKIRRARLLSFSAAQRFRTKSKSSTVCLKRPTRF